LNNRLTPKADRRARPLSLQAAQDGSKATSLFGAVFSQLGDLAFDGGAQLVRVFELVGLLTPTGTWARGSTVDYLSRLVKRYETL